MRLAPCDRSAFPHYALACAASARERVGCFAAMFVLSVSGIFGALCRIPLGGWTDPHPPAVRFISFAHIFYLKLSVHTLYSVTMKVGKGDVSGQKARWKKTPAGKVSRARAVARRRERLRLIVIAAKDCPCQDCGRSYPHYVMDFDHVRGEKLLNIGQASQKNLAPKRIIDEIAKCDVVCSNCHRERTHQRST
jgi:hypothetical protein